MASKPTVAQVVAPSNLEEGYVLDVVLDGKTCGVIVPPGGVKEGESFQGEVVHDVKTAKASSDDVVHFIPEGKWRDDCCDCCSLGCCHPLFWLTWCCPWFSQGQVMTRMSRNFVGGPGEPPSRSNTCMIVVGIGLGILVLEWILSLILRITYCFAYFDFVTGTFQCIGNNQSVVIDSTYRALAVILNLILIVGWLYSCFTTMFTRAAMRRRFNIPGDGCNDCCCSCCCLYCITCHMMRHTNDYRTYDVECCSQECWCDKRGQQAIVPEITV